MDHFTIGTFGLYNQVEKTKQPRASGRQMSSGLDRPKFCPIAHALCNLNFIDPAHPPGRFQPVVLRPEALHGLLS
jgi:hypothetical protein